MFRLKVVVTMTDGSQQTLLTSTPTHAFASASTSPSWLAGGSQTRFNNIYLGEKYDATLDAQFKGWSTVGYDAANWTNAVMAASLSFLFLVSCCFSSSGWFTRGHGRVQGTACYLFIPGHLPDDLHHAAHARTRARTHRVGCGHTYYSLPVMTSHHH